MIGLALLLGFAGASCTSSEPEPAQPVELPVPNDFAFNVFEGAETAVV